MRLSRRDLLALAGIALSGAAVAPSLARAQTPKRGGTLTLRGWDPPMFDPMLQTAYRVQIPCTFTHSRLVKHRAGPGVVPATFQIEGDLAESWGQTNDTTYVFKLRRGVRWHPKPPVNGRELTAEDVRYSVERFLTVKGNPMAYMLKSVDRVEAVDRYTVKFVMKEPFSWLLDVLATPMAVPIVASECVEKFGDLKKAEAVIGCSTVTGRTSGSPSSAIRATSWPGSRTSIAWSIWSTRTTAPAWRRFSPASTTWAGSSPAPSTGATGCRSRRR
jgi:peptide/nickel transport system substrate-binding protein